MAKPSQVLLIEPQNELRFRGPFSESPVTSYLTLTNPTNHKVCFKIKTTAPKRYCVRPNSGRLNPEESSTIAVSLQPSEFDPTEKNKHKFMVQSILVSNDEEDDYTDVWKHVCPEHIMDWKLKCVFENPVSNTASSESTVIAPSAKPDSGTNHATNKGLVDSLKSSPKVLGETEEKLIKAAQEVNQLRAEESNLRQENLQLKEDLLKLRNAAVGKVANLSAAQGLASQSSNQLPLTSTSLLIGVIMVIVGYFLGKLI